MEMQIVMNREKEREEWDLVSMGWRKLKAFLLFLFFFLLLLLFPLLPILLFHLLPLTPPSLLTGDLIGGVGGAAVGHGEDALSP